MNARYDGMTYAPQGKPCPVVKPGEFTFAATHLDHGHIYGQCNGLLEAGAHLKWVYDSDPQRIATFCAKYPQVRAARSLDEILLDPEVKLVAAAAITNERAALGCRVMRAGKDYFTDKAPCTRLDQLAEAHTTATATGRKFMVYFSERLHVESAVFAGELIARGAIGRVLQVMCIAPHRLSKATRPAWFFERQRYGGILCDIGSHQIEQILHFTGATDATVTSSAVANHANPDKPELEDFGEASLIGNNGTSGYLRVDWFTPDGLKTWGDGRTFILGSEGSIELRKYIDVAREDSGDHVYIVDAHGARHLPVAGTVGFPFFGQLVLDCLHRTENAMTQAHVFKAAELCLQAQASARRLA
ncbi:MAG TPA: Gfo/Idh/MocA family oxidoreductase [Lacunisphaera sp.]|jgi:predicted dehydrogenase